MIGAAVAAAVVVWIVARSRRRRARNLGADSLRDALGLVKPYQGPRWKVGRRPEL
jgi:hypothetical protein